MDFWILTRMIERKKMANYTVNYTETEDSAMKYAALSVQDWIDNAAHERARIAIEEIIGVAMKLYLDQNIQIPSSREAIVKDAFDRDWVKTAEERNNEAIQQTT